MNLRYYSNPAFNGPKGGECRYYCQNVLASQYIPQRGPRRHGGLPAEHFNRYDAVLARLRQEVIEIEGKWAKREPDWRKMIMKHRDPTPETLARREKRAKLRAELEDWWALEQEIERKVQRFVSLYRRPLWYASYAKIDHLAAKIRDRWGCYQTSISYMITHNLSRLPRE